MQFELLGKAHLFKDSKEVQTSFRLHSVAIVKYPFQNKKFSPVNPCLFKDKTSCSFSLQNPAVNLGETGKISELVRNLY